jgi:hypothetical protein
MKANLQVNVQNIPDHSFNIFIKYLLTKPFKNDIGFCIQNLKFKIKTITISNCTLFNAFRDAHLVFQKGCCNGQSGSRARKFRPQSLSNH